jgi:hypothetical protein
MHKQGSAPWFAQLQIYPSWSSSRCKSQVYSEAPAHHLIKHRHSMVSTRVFSSRRTLILWNKYCHCVCVCVCVCVKMLSRLLPSVPHSSFLRRSLPSFLSLLPSLLPFIYSVFLAHLFPPFPLFSPLCPEPLSFLQFQAHLVSQRSK